VRNLVCRSHTCRFLENWANHAKPSHATTGQKMSVIFLCAEELSYAKRRTSLYEMMAADLETNGAKFLEGGPTSQSLAVCYLKDCVERTLHLLCRRK
jgi:hypothetical protein